MNHVVMFSGGLSSWGAALKLSREVPNDKIYLLFADTGIEDDDLYRFLEESSTAIQNAELVRIADGRTPWDVFDQVRYVNHRAANCSKELKQKVCRTWIEDNFKPEDTTLYVGIDGFESERLEGIARGWAPYTVKAPLMEGDWWDRGKIESELSTLEIEIPRLYKLGFLHNNCGGFCVRAGKAQFGQLLSHFPERYEEHERREQEFLQLVGRDDVGILRETRGGVRKIVSLKDFRERGRQLSLIEESGTCGCFSDW